MIEIPSPEWHSRAKCVIDHVPVNTFFPERAEGLKTRLELAPICGQCAVRAECLQSALDTSEYDGWWANTSPKERKAINQLGITATQYIEGQSEGKYIAKSVGRSKKSA